MAIQQKLGLSVKLSHRLILTPSLQQAIKLLPLTTLELAEVLDQEVMENPLLEEVPVQETLSTEEIAQQEAKEEAERPDDPLKDIEIEKFFEDYFDDGRRGRPSEIPEAPPIENTLVESPDLYDHLLWQLHMTVSDELTTEIGDAIIQNLDEDGMLRVSLEDVADMGPYPMEEVERALSVVQSLDPAGVAARDLTECLRIQLRVLGLENSPADVMVRDYMKQLQSHQYAEISRQMSLTSEEVAHHLEIIRGLDPRPGNRHSPERSAYILPDVFVVKEGDEYKIVLNDDGSAEASHQPDVSPYARRSQGGLGGDPGLRQGQAPQRPVAAEERGPAAADDLQGLGVDRAAPAGLPGPRHRHLRPLGAAATWPTTSGCTSRRSRGWWPTSTCTRPRGVFELRFFFHSGITSNDGRGGELGHHQAADSEDDRGGGRVAAALRLPDRRDPREGRPPPRHGGRWPSTGRSFASHPRTCARPSTETRAVARPGRRTDEDRVHGSSDGDLDRGADARRAKARKDRPGASAHDSGPRDPRPRTSTGSWPR